MRAEDELPRNYCYCRLEQERYCRFGANLVGQITTKLKLQAFL
jgi:hypothetical protein